MQQVPQLTISISTDWIEASERLFIDLLFVAVTWTEVPALDERLLLLKSLISQVEENRRYIGGWLTKL